MAVERNLAQELRAGWEASLDLEFAAQGSTTRLVRRAHMGPLVVQRPFYPEGDVCHVYVVHPPGGVVGGDRLAMRVQAREGSHALITTPAATKFYRSDGRVACQSQHIAAESARVEWLPQETILFPDAHANIKTRVELSGQSRFIGWEMVCYGRPASALVFAGGRAVQDFELWVNEMPIVLDHLRLDGASEVMQARFGLAGHPVLGTLFAFPADDALLEAARSVAMEGVTTACTRVDGALVCRAVSAQADAVRRLFVGIWSKIRPSVMGRAAVPPRIWAT
ncbi:MAG TPA: urease accessory protein UreD [Steroidobacteraceae bacterium]|nr:urease accessory protein UreD [Steroidobacteraceae bacterium]